MLDYESLDLLKRCHSDYATLFNLINDLTPCKVVGVIEHHSDSSIVLYVIPEPWKGSQINWANTHRLVYFAGFVIATAKILKAKNIIKNEIEWLANWDQKDVISKQHFKDLSGFKLLTRDL